jgi:hypothetical protein
MAKKLYHTLLKNVQVDYKMTHARNILIANIDRAAEAELAIEIEQNALEIQKPFHQWLTANVLNSRNTHLEKIFALIGFAIGAVSTSSAYPLGADFAAQVTGDAQGAGVEFFEVFCGLTAIIPTAVLVGLPTKSEFEKLAAFLLKKPRLPMSKNPSIKQKTALACAHILAAFTGVPFYVLLQPYFANLPFLNVAIPLTAFVSSYCATISVEKVLIENYFISKRQEEELFASTRKRLVNKIDSAKKALEKFSPDAIFKLHAELLKISKKPGETKALEGIRKIFEVCEITYLNLEEQNSAQAVRTWNKFALDIFALTVGVISILVFFEPATRTSELFLSKLGMEDSDFKTFLNNLVAGIAIVSNGIFDAMYSKYDTDRIYEAWQSGQRIPSLKTVCAHGISVLSATPSAYLDLSEATNFIETAAVAPVFLGSMLARALAFDDLLSMAIHSLQKNSPQIKRQNLISILDNLRRSVQLLPPGILLSLSGSLEDVELTSEIRMEQRPRGLIKSQSFPQWRGTFFSKEPQSAPPAIEDYPQRRYV